MGNGHVGNGETKSLFFFVTKVQEQQSHLLCVPLCLKLNLSSWFLVQSFCCRTPTQLWWYSLFHHMPRPLGGPQKSSEALLQTSGWSRNHPGPRVDPPDFCTHTWVRLVDQDYVHVPAPPTKVGIPFPEKIR